MSNRPSPYDTVSRTTTDNSDTSGAAAANTVGKVRKSRKVETPKSIACPKCSRMFKVVWAMRQHVRLEHEDKSKWEHVCVPCNKRFLNKYHLTQHLKWSKSHSDTAVTDKWSKFAVEANTTKETSNDAWSTVSEDLSATDADSRSQSEEIEGKKFIENLVSANFEFMCDNAVDFRLRSVEPDLTVIDGTKIETIEHSFPFHGNIGDVCRSDEKVFDSSASNPIVDFVLDNEWPRYWADTLGNSIQTVKPVAVDSLPYSLQTYCDSVDSLSSL